jgi:hypothetical protein
MHTLLTSTLNGGEQLASRLGRLIQGKNPGFYSMERQVETEALVFEEE